MKIRIVAYRVPAVTLSSDKERKTAQEVVHRMVKRAVEMEGTVTGEHGVGLVKRDYLPHELGESTVDAMRKVCHTLACFQARRWLIRLLSTAQASLRPLVSSKLRQDHSNGETQTWRSPSLVKRLTLFMLDNEPKQPECECETIKSRIHRPKS